MHVQRVAKLEHTEVREIVPSHHCVLRFRQRRPVRDAVPRRWRTPSSPRSRIVDVSGWPPAWAPGRTPDRLWAATADLAFPLERTPTPGRYVATTCLSRPRR